MPLLLSDEPPEREAYFRLFETTGWNDEYHARPEDLERANRNSRFVAAVYDGPELVGFGRVMTDGVLHAMVYDMIVKPERQGEGIGRMILSRLVRRCRELGINDIQLFCATGKREFYEKNGFAPRPADAPGMQWRPDTLDRFTREKT